jgi:hypothetical protein
VASRSRARTAHALGDGQSRVVGAARIRRHPLRLARDRQVSRTPAAPVALRGRGLLRRRRVGRHAAMEQWQGRGDGDLVLRHDRVARGGAPAPTPGSDRAVGRRGRPVSRRQPSRRHLLERFHPGVGEPPAGARPRRRGGGGERTAAAAGDVHGALRAQQSQPTRHPGPTALRRQLGRRGPPPARKRRRLPGRGLRPEVPPGTRRRSRGAVLLARGPSPAAQISRAVPARSRHGHDAGTAHPPRHPAGW